MKNANRTYSATLDAVLDVVEDENGKLVIDPNGENDEEYFLEFLKKNKIEYEVMSKLDDIYSPMIEFTATKENLIPLFELMNASGYTASELKVMLDDWAGDEDELTKIIC